MGVAPPLTTGRCFSASMRIDLESSLMGAPRPHELRRGNAVVVRAQSAVGDSGDRFSSWRRGELPGKDSARGRWSCPCQDRSNGGSTPVHASERSRGCP